MALKFISIRNGDLLLTKPFKAVSNLMFVFLFTWENVITLDSLESLKTLYES